MGIKKQNPASLAGQNGASKDVQDINVNKNKNRGITPLLQEQIDELQDALPLRAKQARRFVGFVALNPEANTAQCNQATLAVNLSDLAVKYNPYLEPHGYKLACKLPANPLRNRLGEKTMMHLWYLSEVGQEECYA